MDNSLIYFLAGVPLDSKQENTLSWGTQSEQSNYFSSKRIGSLTGTYQRKDSVIRYDGGFDEISTCNYVMYQNTNQSNKWYYAFVIDIEYINDSRTDIYIKTDVIQTYYFDINYKQCFVEREHVMNDALGANTIPENLELGQYIKATTYNTWKLYGVGNVSILPQHIIIGTNVDLTTGEDIYGSAQYGMYSGIVYFGYRFPDQVDIVTALLSAINGLGKIDGIKTMFMIPSVFVSEGSGGRVSLRTEALYQEIPLNNTINGYTPKNTKLKCYPYNMIYVSNKQGQSNYFRYEAFHGTDTTPRTLTVRATINEGSKPFLFPRQYEGKASDYDNGITMPSWQQCSFSSSTFDAWFAQNGASWAVSTLVSGVTAATSLYTGNAAGVVGGLTGVFNSMVQLNNQMIQPPSMQGNSGAISTLHAYGDNWFDVSQKCITAEYAKIIDNYFEMFGYKVNQLKTPSIRTRTQWNYVKTIECNIGGNINVKDSEEIKSIFNNGLRFWRNPNNVGNFSLNNHEGVAK